MREKNLTVIITFVSTTQAMAMESRGKKTGFEGRIIPVPREISASCGLAWKCGGQNQDTVEKYLSEEDLEYEGIYRDPDVTYSFDAQSGLC